MEWLLIVFLPAFVVLAILIKPLYDKWYGGLYVPKGFYDPRLEAYLHRFEDLVEKREYAMSYMGMHGFEDEVDDLLTRLHDTHLDKPGIWEKDLQSVKEKWIRVLSQAALVTYAMLMMFLIWSGVSYGWVVNDLGDAAKAFAPFSLIAVLYWRHRRSFCDGSIQGYLNGYMDALEHAALRNQEKDRTK